ncbi:Autophagy protein 16 [Bienertia sinuspersici]
MGKTTNLRSYMTTSMLITSMPWAFKNMSTFYEDLKAQLSSLELGLSDAALSQKKDKEQIQSQRARIDEVQQRRDELRKELLQLDEEESKLLSLLANNEDSLQKHVTIEKDVTDSHTSLEKNITIAEEVAAKLEEANKGLKDAHDSLMSFKWET